MYKNIHSFLWLLKSSITLLYHLSKIVVIPAEPILNSRKMDYFETSGGDSVFVSTLRVVYVKQVCPIFTPLNLQHANQMLFIAFIVPIHVSPSLQNTGNQGIVLSSRAFVPRRLSHKTSETTSQTVERMNVWLSCTGIVIHWPFSNNNYAHKSCFTWYFWQFPYSMDFISFHAPWHVLLFSWFCWISCWYV